MSNCVLRALMLFCGILGATPTSTVADFPDAPDCFNDVAQVDPRPADCQLRPRQSTSLIVVPVPCKHPTSVRCADLSGINLAHACRPTITLELLYCNWVVHEVLDEFHVCGHPTCLCHQDTAECMTLGVHSSGIYIVGVL